MINKNSRLAQEFYESGRLADCPVYDFHAHMHRLSSIYFPSHSPERMIATMRRCNVKLTVFCSHYALDYADYEDRYNLQEAKRFPEYFLAYHSVIPGRTDFKQMVARIEANRQYYFGYGEMHADFHATPYTDSAYAPFFEYADANKLPALLHTWGYSECSGVDVVRKIAERYPNTTLICGHAFHGDWQHGAEVMRDYPNMMPELTAVMDDCGAIELLCRVVGSDRILFGVDLPWFDVHHGIGAVLSADISDDDMRNIFYRNAEKLLEGQGGGSSTRPFRICSNA